MEFLPGKYYIIKTMVGPGFIPVRATESIRYIKDGEVGKAIHALTGRTVAVYPSRIVKETTKAEIADSHRISVNLVI